MRDILSVEESTQAVQGARHSVELQSIRGIAALVVVVHHCTFYFRYDPSIKYGFEVAFNAHAAVVSFFVLSGFVLTRSWGRNQLQLPRIIPFYIRRAFRIYPALWAAIMVAALYSVLFYHSALPSVVDPWWDIHTRSPALTTFHAFSTLVGNRTQLPLPIWTLQAEIAGSLLIPFIAWVAVRTRYAFWGMLIALMITSQFERQIGPSQFMVDFALGASINRLSPLLHGRLNKFSAIALACLGFLFLWFCRLPFDARFLQDYNAKMPALLEAVGATVMIAVIFSFPKPFGFLRKSSAVWLGDISYSLYLIHIPILALVAGFGVEVLQIPIFRHGGLLAMSALAVFTLAISVPLAAILYRYIEIPGIQTGKVVDAAIKRRLRWDRPIS